MSNKNYIIIKNKYPSIPLLFCCDHASNLIPNQYKNLRLNNTILNNHIAYDIGAKKLTKQLTSIFNTNAILGKYSRLFIDLNRNKNHINLIPEKSDGIKIPGNKNILKSDKIFRIKKFYDPYHKICEDTLEKMDELFSCKTALICIHSYTPAMQNRKKRPWEIGLLYRNDLSLFKPIIKSLKQNSNFKIGINKPYSGFDDVNYTMTYHGEINQRPFISIEIRNDIFSDENNSKLNKLIINLTQAIYYSHITLGKPYITFAKKLNLF
jgi:predicted N-formylglutamate amidohydrolase